VIDIDLGGGVPLEQRGIATGLAQQRRLLQLERCLRPLQLRLY
jgi:hypothetical protein